jgi:hypothetical protein
MAFCHLFLELSGDKVMRNHYSIKHCEEASILTWLALAWSGLGLDGAALGNPEIGRKYVEKRLKIYRDAQIDWLTSFHLFTPFCQKQRSDPNLTQTRATELPPEYGRHGG